MPVLALIPIDLHRGRLGTRRNACDELSGDSVLMHTVRRIARVVEVDAIVLVHPAGQDPLAAVDTRGIDKPIHAMSDPDGLVDRHTGRLRIARQWAPAAWRGGLGGACVFDELLPPDPLLAAMEAHGGSSCLIVGGDWPLVDPSLCAAVLRQHLSAPDGMKLTFTQAPPGLCGVATCIDVLRDLARHGASFGNILGYNPRAPIGDPIGREANLPIPPAVRDCGQRLVYDTARSAAVVRRVLDRDALANATDSVRLATEASDPFAMLPPWITLELTPRREVVGPITPHHYGRFDRPDMEPNLAERLVAEAAEVDDAVLLFGGLGDAVLHPQWPRIVSAAADAGVASIGIETDLLCGEDDVRRLLDAPIDVISVRLNADTAATYASVMGADRFATVIRNMELLLNTRNRRHVEAGGPAGVPWLLPRLVKTRQTTPELESFFDKWTLYAGHAVIEPACEGCGSMPTLSPVPMQPPRRRPCRQVGRRMSILSDGAVAQCDQDWHGRSPLGDALSATLAEIWSRGADLARAHAEERFADLTLCGGCVEWHRP